MINKKCSGKKDKCKMIKGKCYPVKKKPRKVRWTKKDQEDFEYYTSH